MLREFGQATPRQILEKYELIIEKPIPDNELVTSTIDNLPVANRTELTLHGNGDWDNARSSGGSVVLNGGSYILKVALGEQVDNKDPLVKAAEMARTSKKFEKVSPPTEFFIANVDGPDKPAKVIIYQRKNHGKPACDTPIDTLLSPEATQKFNMVIDEIQSVLYTDNLQDSVGIHLNNTNPFKKTITRLICNLPWLSDNIMVDGNKVELVDNTPAFESHIITNPIKKQINSIRLTLSKKLLNFTSRVYSYSK